MSDKRSPETFVPDAPMTSADFHNATQQQVVHLVQEILNEAKLPWKLIHPFQETARDLARADFAEADIRLHGVQADGEDWVAAEEAYLGISVADRESGEPWLADTFWLSDIATQDEDPARARAVVAALERSIARINAWIAEQDGAATPEATPPAI
jgi:hypothetical protein